jgi:hypothetical protein
MVKTKQQPLAIEEPTDVVAEVTAAVQGDTPMQTELVATSKGISAAHMALIEPLTTKSAKIRALWALGYKRAEIAKALGILYQHVRNVLTQVPKKPTTAQVAPIPGAVTPTAEPQAPEAAPQA